MPTFLRLSPTAGINLDTILAWYENTTSGPQRLQSIRVDCLGGSRYTYTDAARLALLAYLQGHGEPLVVPEAEEAQSSVEARLSRILGCYLLAARGRAELTNNLLSAAGHVLFWEFLPVSRPHGACQVGEAQGQPFLVQASGACSCKQPGVWQCSHALAVRLWRELDPEAPQAEEPADD